MNVLAIISAVMIRDGRETGALAPLGGEPLLGFLLQRVARADKLAAIAVATSDAPEDEPIRAFCAARGVTCQTGDADDLIGRLLAALRAAGAKGGVLIDARNPLIDPALITQVADLLQMTDGMLDWIGNTLAPTYPRGMEIDGFTLAALAEAEARCGAPEQRRRGPAFLRENSRIYRPLSLKAPPEAARPELRLDVESPGDLPRIEAILRCVGGRTDFTLAELIAAAGAGTASRSDPP
ncbi:cytidylyltransferase domain-containing protein [Methylosinus sp. Sm6]|uniref:cytidylyltransferase domain-containing protein n=1 Tax=Methylosinus sp. Sm6 TaxID=2866948 RepID=UPI001C990B08|nr:NTP transferase domain-containing protein [Methylosinus sp. Sm6]MBY6243961.1 NTP transferase domain-containing protein [Methylosinus sp. Sm6]